jgi:GT2 family glycosyltransferase
MKKPVPGDEAQSGLRSRVARTGDSQVSGHVVDLGEPERRFVVELLIDRYPAALARADVFDPDLAREGLGDGCHGFVFFIEPHALQSARRVEIRLANSGEIVGAPLLVRAPQRVKDRAPGAARWDGALRFTGWVAGDPARAQRIRALVDGELAAEALATRWTHVGDAAGVRAFRRFDLCLPQDFADGRARAATIVTEDGVELPGSPCAFVAFPDGLARFLDGRAEIESERLRGALYDRLTPPSLPFDMFEDWRGAHPPAPATDGNPTKIAIVLIGEAGIEASVAGLEAQQGCEWVAGALEGGAGPVDFDPALLRQFLDDEASDCPLIAFALSGAVLEPPALAMLAAALDAFPEAPLVYADFALRAPDGSQWPVALPAFDYELTLEQGCGALFFAARADYVRAAAEAGASDLFRLFLFCQDRRRSQGAREEAREEARDGARESALREDAPVHQPGVLARLPKLDLDALSARLADAVSLHLGARGVSARVARGRGAVLPLARVARAAPEGGVSILIPTRDRADLLQACAESLARTVDLARHEIVVLDNDSAEPETADCLHRLAAAGARIQHVAGPFNFSRIVNQGASGARGEFVLVLDPAIEALERGWLDEMLSRIAEPDVGAVGAALLWPSGIVQHGGIVLGPEFSAAHAFDDCLDGDSGYGDLLRAAHECSAVTASCLLTDKKLLLAAGGFDGAHFPVNFGDVDYCLKLRARGLRVVMTPHARLLYRENVARGLELRADQAGRFEREKRNLRTAWRDALLADPAYNPMLALGRTPYSALAWPPRAASPRQPGIPPRRPIPPGF